MATTKTAREQVEEIVGSGEARRLRIACGISTNQASQALRVTWPAYSKWELGLQPPTEANSERYLAFLRQLPALEKAKQQYEALVQSVLS